MATTKKEPTTPAPTELTEQVPGATDEARAAAALDAEKAAEPGPVDITPPPDAYDVPVRMRDVASLNGIGIAPDASVVRTVKASEVEFISAGMAGDLEQFGHAVDPVTGVKVLTDKRWAEEQAAAERARNEAHQK